jgi:hypothetical protein
MAKSVQATDHIWFDETFKTFRLRAGETLYAFCITPELTLEHLYWGKTLPDHYDLRYLSQSCRMAHFNTVEVAPHSFDGKIVLEADTLEEIQKTWRMNVTKKTDSKDEDDYFNKRRIENYSWRIMSQITQASMRSRSESSSGSEGKFRRKSLSVTFDIGHSMEEELQKRTNEDEPIFTRKRSISLPVDPKSTATTGTSLNDDSNLNLLDLNLISKITTTQKSHSPDQKVAEAKSKMQQRHYANRQTFERQLGKIGKGTLCVEYTDYGTGDFRTPSFMVVDNSNGSAISPLRYRRHKIFRGKLPMPDSMPAIRCMNESEASTLVITMADINSGLEVDLVYGT